MKNKQLSLVTFEQAQRLKKAGFDWPTEHYYEMQAGEYPARYRNDFDFNFNGANGGKTSAPPVALALQYMRNVHNICGDIYRIACGWVWSISKADNGTSVEDLNERGPNDGGAFDDFDDCASNVLDELLTLIEK